MCIRDRYYADAVAWASANDIVTGYNEEKFGPDDSITREQFAAILYRYAQYKKIDVTATADLSGYADAAQILSLIHIYGLIDLYENGVINNKYCTTDPGVMTVSFVMGTRRLYDFVDRNPAVNFQISSAARRCV